ncbi:AraC family transcriptional regulator [Metabacillus dongyingensis]|uniref:helix-turn-helix domain-containing protein n=1 Tax=Metabacillus dongyingensis TaxID=2874282 RepID=UPI003B8C9EFB
MKKMTSRLMLQYIFSYLIIFFVPFSVMALILYHNSVSSIREEIELSNLHNLNHVKNLTDSRMQELSKIGTLISYDPNLTPYMIKMKENHPDAIKSLDKYKENSSIITDLYLYYNEQDHIYSSEGLMSTNTFIEYKTTYTEMKTFLMDIESSTYPFISNNLKLSNNTTAYIYPLPSGAVEQYGSVIFKLKDSFFKDMINNILGTYEGKVFILDHNNKVIATNNRYSETIDLNQIEKIASSKKSFIGELKIDGNSYSISSVNSERSNWSFVAAIPTEQFYGKVSKFSTFIWLIILGIAAAASILAIMLGLYQYRPIKKIIEFIKNKDESLQFTSNNELDTVRNTLENIYLNQEQLNKIVLHQEPLVRDQCLMMLLQGQMDKYMQSEGLLESLNIQIDGPYSFVFTTELTSRQLSTIDMKKLELSSSSLIKEVTIFSVELINNKTMVYVANGNSDNPSVKERLINEFQRILMKHNPNPKIGVGETYKGINHINRSFIEASAALEFAKLSEKRDIIAFTEIDELNEKMWIPKEYLLKLSMSYKQGDAEIASETIITLFNWLRDNSSSIHLLKGMTYDVVNTITKTVNDMNVPCNFGKIYQLIERQSFIEIEKNLIEMTIDICAEISKTKESQKNQLEQNILDYLTNHYAEYELSLEGMAEQFGLSSSYLSRFIKEQTGTTFSQYVWNLRTDEVKKQLLQTNSSIKKIISEVGYIDVPNFIRKFKNSEGITPGQFRKLYTKATE